MSKSNQRPLTFPNRSHSSVHLPETRRAGPPRLQRNLEDPDAESTISPASFPECSTPESVLLVQRNLLFSETLAQVHEETILPAS